MGKRANWWAAVAWGAAALTGQAGAADAATNILFILDVSNSMWGQVDGVAKIETAKSVLSDLLGDLGPDTRVGFMAYGHRSEGDCNDIELISPVGAAPPAQLIPQLMALVPKGKTPIAGALTQAATAFAAGEASNNVILISDGVESCAGDPCAVAASLAAANVETRVHVVGFDIGAEERAQLECIALKGNGRYFNAGNVDEFKTAVAEVRQEAETVEPEPAPQVAQAETWTEVFRDDFDGADLAEHWEVANPNPDQFVVENGSLVVIAKDVGGLSNEAMVNLFKLGQPLPGADWRMTVTFSAELQTGREGAQLALYDDVGNYIASYLYGNGNICCYYSELFLRINKVSGGESTRFDLPVWPRGAADFSEYAKEVKQPISLRLSKEGRSYKAAVHFAGENDEAGEPVWKETEVVTSLRAPKQIVLGVLQWEATEGESLFQFDSLVIEAKGQ